MKSQEKAEKPRKTFGLSLNRELMLEIQHLALDQDRYVNEVLEEAARDLLSKYAAQSSGKIPDSKGRR